MSYLFISYSRSNADYVEKLYAHLTHHDVEVVFDTMDMPYGMEFPQWIVNKIQGCAAFTVIMSSDARESVWVNREINYALTFNKPILPLWLEGDIFDILKPVNCFDVRGGLLPKPRYITQIKQILSTVPPPIPSLISLSHYIAEHECLDETEALRIFFALENQLTADHRANKMHSPLTAEQIKYLPGNPPQLEINEILIDSATPDESVERMSDTLALLRLLFHMLTGQEIKTEDTKVQNSSTYTRLQQIVIQGLDTKTFLTPDALRQRLEIYANGDLLRPLLNYGLSYRLPQLVDHVIHLCSQLEQNYKKGLSHQNLNIDNVEVSFINNRDYVQWIENNITSTIEISGKENPNGIFAIGAILFEMLTHQPLPPNTQPEALLQLIHAQAPAEVSFGLDFIVIRALTSDPAKRFRSVAMLRERLQSYQARLKQATEISDLVKATYPIVYLETWEEERALRLLNQIATIQGKKLYWWTTTQGLLDVTGMPVKGASDLQNPLSVLNFILRSKEKALYVLLDLHPFLEPTSPLYNPVCRFLRDWAEQIRPLDEANKGLVFISPVLRIPSECDKDISPITLGFPNPGELADTLDTLIDRIRTQHNRQIVLSDVFYEKLVLSAMGLPINNTILAFTRAYTSNLENLNQPDKFNAAIIDMINSEKERAIYKSSAIEIYPASEDFGDVGGLANLKRWAKKRGLAFTYHAQEFGVSAPKGVLLVGVPGCGKSLAARAFASEWEMPLLRLDASALFQPQVGKSETNMRNAIQIAEAIAPCVLWIDEIEKGFSNSGTVSDSGVSARVIGTLITWLQEKTAPVFVIATANTIGDMNSTANQGYANRGGLPPEMLRKGRFDEIFFVDLPDAKERSNIFKIHLNKRHQDISRFDLQELAEHSTGLSGAEIEQVVVSALSDAFFGLDQFYRKIEETINNFTTFSADALKDYSEEAVEQAIFEKFVEIVSATPQVSGNSALSTLLDGVSNEFDFEERLREAYQTLVTSSQEDFTVQGLTQETLLRNLADVYPLSLMMKAQIDPFREWARRNTTPASGNEE